MTLVELAIEMPNGSSGSVLLVSVMLLDEVAVTKLCANPDSETVTFSEETMLTWFNTSFETSMLLDESTVRLHK